MLSKLRLFGFILVALLLVGCSKGLSRSTAKGVLEQYLAANPVSAPLQLNDAVMIYPSDGSSKAMIRYRHRECWRQLAARGLVNEATTELNRTETQTFNRTVVTYFFWAVDILKPEAIVEVKTGMVDLHFKEIEARTATVRLATRDLVSIDAISEPAPVSTGQLMSWANFTYTETGTGFYEPTCGHVPELQPKTGPQTGRAGFTLYDTGWRLEKMEW
jgi:hypothetical protein